jgi:hypothetical protein
VVLEGFPADRGGTKGWDREVPARNGSDPYRPVPPLGTPWNVGFSVEYPWYHLYPLRKHSLTTGGLSDCERRCASLPECWTCPSRCGQRHGSPTTWPRRRLAHERARRLSEASHPESVTRATLVGQGRLSSPVCCATKPSVTLSTAAHSGSRRTGCLMPPCPSRSVRRRRSRS